MKILITTECYFPVINGVVTSVMTLRKELINMGHEVKILTLSGKKRSFEKDDVIYIGSLGLNKLYPGARIAFPFDNVYLRKVIGWKPDVIHSQSEFSTFQMAKLLSRKLEVPIVHTYHTIYEDYTHYFSPYKKWGKRVAQVFTKSILKHTSGVIAPTVKVQSLLIKYGVSQKIHVVPSGINLGLFDKRIEDKGKLKLKQKIGIPPNKKVLLFVGRLAKEKRLEEILYFVYKFNDENILLLIVGDGPNRAFLEKYVQKLGISNQVIFVGMVPSKEVIYYYQVGDIFVSASTSETQGLTYLEALANGLPALCRQDMCLENVIMDGINGWQYNSYENFADKLSILLFQDEEYRRLSYNARERVALTYSSIAFARKIEGIYQDTVATFKRREIVEEVVQKVQ
ncbi:glycosyltransferase family 4 protein [Oceanobacillus piezotolerans]|uniref:Glycosyltransferase family 4 protein n=1 Tax=Oceanobacillus piezotolerans TaxID=2448030 RepID=A0A498DAH7_9BACI|nr:glycosyltransferase family 4 protein [Oceanobacillus piezotolerans]RLL46578.1 glycosyltransferase family 4 protein [Oceanobacillus piezotolerans]